MASTVDSLRPARDVVAASAPPAVEISGLTKAFRIPHRQYSTFKERALHPLARARYRELHALKRISFDVHEGEFFGIVGRNGSGKSTLLKCLAGIYGTDSEIKKVLIIHKEFRPERFTFVLIKEPVGF